MGLKIALAPTALRSSMAASNKLISCLQRCCSLPAWATGKTHIRRRCFVLTHKSSDAHTAQKARGGPSGTSVHELRVCDMPCSAQETNAN